MSITNDLLVASAAIPRAEGLSDERYDRQLRDHITYLRQLSSGKQLDSIVQDRTLLDYFDPSKDSLTYLFLLHLQIRVLQETTNETFPPDLLPSGHLWSKSLHYLKVFDHAQVRYAGHEWRQLIELVVQAAQTDSKAFLAASLIKDAMLRLDPSCAVVTSTHLLLVQLSLAARAYSCALPILEKQICHIPVLTGRPPFKSLHILCAEHECSLAFMNDSTGLSSKPLDSDYLRYFLYGGMIYMALKKWDKALHFLGTVISMPTTGSVSMIMVEAYKKWILAGLLESGKLCPLPDITGPHVVKTLQSLAKPYLNLAGAFERGDIKRLEAEAATARDVWYADNNMGLVSQVLGTFSRHTLVKTRKVFAALTVPELSAQALAQCGNGNGFTESNIASLIMSGALDATLVHSHSRSSESMLRFSTCSSLPPLLHENEMQRNFQIQEQLLDALSGSVEEGSYRLGLRDEYIDNFIRGQAWPSAGGMNSSFAGNTGLEMEEDIMGDLS